MSEGLTGERWRRLEELFEAAVELTKDQQEALIAEVAAQDPAVGRELAGMLAHSSGMAERIGKLVESSALAVAGMGAVYGGQVVGAWRLLEEIGRGGMGTVWGAERADGAFRKKVALKLVSRGMDTDVILRRFHQERQILASLSHPNITALLDGGATADGLPYFVMELVEGSPITAFCRERALPLRARLELFCTVSDAVAYAHRNHVLHRDLKPSNILVTAEGVPKLLDFGIAKLLTAQRGEEATLTKGLGVLTPDYASPEQVRAEPVSETADVYSLGVLLYELVAGCRPYEFQTRSPQEIASIVCEREPAKPSAASRRPELKGDLDSIVGMSLRKEPQFRYASVEELAADVRRHLTGQPVRAVRPTMRYRTRKFVRRQGARLALATAMVFLALVGLMLWLNVQGRSMGQGGSYRKSAIAEANEYFERAAAVEKVDLDEERIAGLLQRAVERDPNFTAARSRYGFYLLGMIDHGRSNDPKLLDRAETELRRAEREDPNVASNYAFLSVLSYYRRQWDQMEKQCDTAVRLDPRDIDASMSLVPLLRLRGDYPQAIRLCQRVLQRDPTFVAARGNLAELYRFSGDLDGCIREMERIPEQENAPPVLASLANAYLDRGEPANARQKLEKMRSQDRGNYYLRLSWALLMACEGNAEGARAELDQNVVRWADLYPEGRVSAAEIYSVLGETENALAWLDKGVHGGDHRKSWFLLDPHLANLRHHPRFQGILDSIPTR